MNAAKFPTDCCACSVEHPTAGQKRNSFDICWRCVERGETCPEDDPRALHRNRFWKRRFTAEGIITLEKNCPNIVNFVYDKVVVERDYRKEHQERLSAPNRSREEIADGGMPTRGRDMKRNILAEGALLQPDSIGSGPRFKVEPSPPALGIQRRTTGLASNRLSLARSPVRQSNKPEGQEQDSQYYRMSESDSE